MNLFTIEQMAALLGLLLAALAITMLMIRYSNKKHAARIEELKQKLKKIEKEAEETKSKKTAEEKEIRKRILAIEEKIAEKKGKE